MKKQNKKSSAIRLKKAQKRNRAKKKYEQRSSEKLSMRTNQVQKIRETIQAQYLEMLSKQFEVGS